ncbi:MAG: DUF262 domain-containing protein [Elusimicrobiota bacterium]
MIKNKKSKRSKVSENSLEPLRKLSPIDDDLLDEHEENVLPPENIVVLNELRSASDLHRLMLDNDSINIRPDFQRNEVWDDSMRARFIDSLSKEFPIPSMCFALDAKEQKYIVIDGLQRMSTIRKFLEDPNWVLPKLKDIDEHISGKSVADIKKLNPKIFRKIENISLPITILRYDPNRQDNMDYIFTIFQRLNSFGEHLNNQEIRNALYQGPFNSFIKDCIKNEAWISIIQNDKKTNKKRMVVEERTLRFFAFYDYADKYDGKLNKFLNSFMQKNRYSKDNSSRKKVFDCVIEIIKKIKIEKIGKSNAFRDAFLYGIAKNIEILKEKNNSQLETYLEKLKSDNNFSVDALSGGIMQKSKVKDRLEVAVKIFSGKV